MSSLMDPEDFVKALSAETEIGMHSLFAEGFVRITADANVIEFSPTALLCIRWVKIPLAMIEKVQRLGKKACGDHVHDYAILYFKKPSNEEAAVFAQMIGGEMAAPEESTHAGAATTMDEGVVVSTLNASQYCVTVYSASGGVVLARKTITAGSDAEAAVQGYRIMKQYCPIGCPYQVRRGAC
jgi:hypothetical protein